MQVATPYWLLRPIERVLQNISAIPAADLTSGLPVWPYGGLRRHWWR